MSKVKPWSRSCSRSPPQSPVNFGRESQGPPKGGGCESACANSRAALSDARLGNAEGYVSKRSATRKSACAKLVLLAGQWHARSNIDRILDARSCRGAGRNGNDSQQPHDDLEIDIMIKVSSDRGVRVAQSDHFGTLGIRFLIFETVWSFTWAAHGPSTVRRLWRT